MLTISEASQAVGVSRSGLLKAIKSGKLSAKRDDSVSGSKPAKYLIDPSELYRVFPKVSESARQYAHTPHTDAHGINEANLYQARINDLERRVDDLVKERDRYWDILQAEMKDKQLLLSVLSPQPEKATSKLIWIIALILIVVGSIGYWVASRQLSV